MIPVRTQNIKGTGQKMFSMPSMSPEQQNLFSTLMGGVSPGVSPALGFLKGLSSGDPSAFASMEAPAFKQFQQILGDIGSRFSGMGTEGAQDSSAFNLATTQAGQDLAERLQAQRMGIQKDSLRDLLGLSERLTQTPTEQFGLVQRKQKTPWWQIFAGMQKQGLESVGNLAKYLMV